MPPLLSPRTTNVRERLTLIGTSLSSSPLRLLKLPPMSTGLLHVDITTK
jgi:hypothetical protein